MGEAARDLVVDPVRIDGENGDDGGDGCRNHQVNDAGHPEINSADEDCGKRKDVARVVPEFVASDLVGEALFAHEAERQAHQRRSNDSADDGCRGLAAEDGIVVGARERPQCRGSDEDHRQDDQRPLVAGGVDQRAEEGRRDHTQHAADGGDHPEREGVPAVRRQEPVEEWSKTIAGVGEEEIEGSEGKNGAVERAGRIRSGGHKICFRDEISGTMASVRICSREGFPSVRPGGRVLGTARAMT